MNPLLAREGMPRFDAIRAEHVGPAMDQVLQAQRERIATLRTDSQAPDWLNFVQPLEDAIECVARVWGQVGHLNAVVNTAELREAYNASLPKVTLFWAELAQDEALFARYRKLADSPAYAVLTPVQRRVVDNELRDFRLGGADLSNADKQRFLAVQEELSALSARFEANLIDTTRAWAHLVTDADALQGLPADVIEAAARSAAEAGLTGWKFTLHAPSYLPVMQYASHRPLREALYRGYGTRASEFGEAEWDNGPIITRMLALRAEQARLLGYASYAELSLVPKMADSPADVIAFLRDLATRARPYALRDMDELRRYARDSLQLSVLEPWDIPYVSECLRQARYAYSDQEVRRYLPATQVLAGLFGLIERLYRVQVREATAAVWHPEVHFYELLDADGVRIGHFYLDLYARDGKRGGAWMDDAITRRQTGAGLQTPVAYLTCNFTPPLDGRPATLTHDEVLTLFHECGHGLHHLLSRVGHYAVSGIHGVEWDAVELPSQFMENFAWEWDVLSGMSRHVDTGATLPLALYERLLAARNFQSGMHTIRQIEFALFDMLLYGHSASLPADGGLALLAQIRAEIAVVVPPAWHRFPMSFSHIFSGGYAAGYYSYKWAEVLSADAYSLFEERGPLDPGAGRQFLDEVLAVGGSRPALESFIAFRGRAPRIDALLRHHGMADGVVAAAGA